MKSTVLKVIMLISCITGAIHAEENITVLTQDNGAALVNPGMGWMMYFYSNVPANYGSHLSPADITPVSCPSTGRHANSSRKTARPSTASTNAWATGCNQRMGYRLQPLEVTWPKNVTIGAGPANAASPQGFEVKWSWANKGVAPCYSGGFPCLTLKDAEGGIVSVLTDESLDMRDLKVGPPGEHPVTAHVSQFAIGQFAPATRPGSYDLFISVGTRDGTPTIAPPLTDNDGQRRYRLGTVTLQNPGKDKFQP